MKNIFSLQSKLLIVILIVFLLVLSFSFQNAITSIDINIESEDYCWIVWNDATYCYARNGTSGNVEYMDTDCATVINDCIINGSGKILIKAGLYNITSDILPDESTFLMGEGMNNTILKTGANDINVIEIMDVTNVTIMDLTVDGSKEFVARTGGADDRCGILVRDSEYIQLVRCQARNVPYYGIHFYINVKKSICDGCKVTNNYVGFSCYNNIRTVSFCNGIIFDNTYAGLNGHNSIKGLIFANNVIGENDDDEGIYFYDIQNLNVNNNCFRDSYLKIGQAGLPADNISITGNYIADDGTYCMEISTGKFCIIDGNTVVGTTYGMRILSGYNNVSVTNNIFNTCTVGIRIDSEDNIVNDNLFNGCTTDIDDRGDRTLINGCGSNAGNPNSAGLWNGYGEKGNIVFDTSNSKFYINYDGTNWQAVS